MELAPGEVDCEPQFGDTLLPDAELAARRLDPDPLNLADFDSSRRRAQQVIDIDKDNIKLLLAGKDRIIDNLCNQLVSRQDPCLTCSVSSGACTPGSMRITYLMSSWSRRLSPMSTSMVRPDVGRSSATYFTMA